MRESQVNQNITNSTSTQASTVAVVGGGLAGLAAGCALADSGFRVSVFERRPYLGGRASSYQHPGTGEVVDNCQHVLFGCCTNLIEFYKRIGVSEKIRWSDEMTFVEPGGRMSVLRPAFLPAPLHTMPSFLSFPFLDVRDKFAIARAMAFLVPHALPDTGESFMDWLRKHRQTEMSIERFWKPILVSALSEDLDQISVSAAAQVVRESMKSDAARRMGIPAIPLTDLYSAAQNYITNRGGSVRLRSGIESLQLEDDKPVLTFAEGFAKFDFVILAVPYFALASLLPQNGDAQPLREQISHFQSSPITGIHLWFDKQISDLEHAVLLDRTVQWMFHKSKLLGRNTEGSYVELVVSASKSLIEKSKQEIVDMALSEVREFFPEARSANLVKSTVIKEVNATYSPKPGIDVHRPKSETSRPRVFLAGDWTATGWPATMEGAVRSGYLAAEALVRITGKSDRFLIPDLPPAGFMRLFG
ncbi:MAG TPA: hydroxysqualene dehydroxylase HpnE [Terriglobales bacterium]|nr:hydroxysqualene dehydroxylase HpnE [Terriglobales bacterium]